jgi:uncharacterized protein YyaL (SSP411 family)
LTDASSTSHRHTNRLIHETSPYLLQHAHNPVDWYPWGPEAFERARREDKPIFLSVGYSTCYWCHVMERQSFEKDAVAAEMNKRFVNIKVDREERPDVDQLYMTAVQVLTRHGGWPMSVFLTPDLRPFYGGTYFPPEDMHGRPGFVTLLRAIDGAFHEQRQNVNASAGQLVEILKRVAEPAKPQAAITIDQPMIEQLIDRSVDDFDSVHGGFGGAPKFPRETLLELLLAYSDSAIGGHRAAAGKRKSEIIKMLCATLDAMANGGIRDHLGGGFHRYSTDAQWLVPHFELMLYDNAMLAYVYAEAFRQTNEQRYARVARGICDFVLREMTSADGAFYTAFDAEVDAMEGASYLWTEKEIEEVLGRQDAEIFNRVYGVDRGPNFVDPHHGSGVPDKNILYLARGPEMEDDSRIAEMRQKLKAVRDKRKQPLLDTKIITSWNALMIRALAFGSKVLSEPRYQHAAIAAAEFLLRAHRRADDGLYRTSRDGKPKYDGFLDDYAFLAQALMELWRVTKDEKWRVECSEICDQMLSRFGDPRNGGYFFTDANSSTELIVRQKVASDSPLPSGNAVAALTLLGIEMESEAKSPLTVFAEQLVQQAEGMSSMVQAAMEYVRARGPISVEASPAASVREKPRSPEELARNVVEISGAMEPQQLVINLRIADGYHIHAHEPAAGMVATEIRFADATEIERIDYPPPDMQKFQFSDSAIPVYAGEAKIAVKFKSPRTSPPKFSLTYQACDETSCLPPVTVRIETATGSE